MAEQFYRQNNFSGGLSDSDIYGLEGSFAEAVGVDIHSMPRVLRVSQAMKKESTAGVVVDLPLFAIYSAYGDSYFFGDKGHIYKRVGSPGVYSVVYTDAHPIQGACEFNGYIWWASNSKLNRKPMPGLDDWSDVELAYATLTGTTWHIMVIQGIYMFIGNGNTIASVDDAGTFTPAGTPSVTFNSLPSELQITTMISYGIDILVGTLNSLGYAQMLRYDFSVPSPIAFYQIPEQVINAFIPNEDYILIQAGYQGTIYYYNGQILRKFRRIRGDYTGKMMRMYPASYCSFRGISLMGISNYIDDPCLEGIYSIGQYDTNYPLALMLEYVISPNKLTGVKIGCMLSIGNARLLVGWTDGTNFGVDDIDWTAKYPSAYVKTLVLGGNRETSKNSEEYLIGYKQKPTGTAISLSTYTNYSSTPISLAPDDYPDFNKLLAQQKIDAALWQLRLDFTISGNDAPEVDLIYCKWEVEQTL